MCNKMFNAKLSPQYIDWPSICAIRNKLTILRAAGCGQRAAGCGKRAIYNCCLVIRSLHKKTEMTKFILFFCFVYNTSTEYDH